MHCTNCGVELPDQSKFCSSCGNEISHGDSADNSTAADNSDKSENLSASQIIGYLAIGIIAIGIYATIDLGGSSEEPRKETPVAAAQPQTAPAQPGLAPLESSQFAPDEIGLRVYKLKDGPRNYCNIVSEAFNNKSVVLQELFLKVRIHDTAGLALETESWWYSNVRPGRSVTHEISTVENVSCAEIGRLEIEAIRTCQFGGTNYNASYCGSFLTFPDGKLEWQL